jgi:hypothetical protein
VNIFWLIVVILIVFALRLESRIGMGAVGRSRFGDPDFGHFAAVGAYLTVGELAQLLTAIAACIGAVSSLRNSRKLSKVERATDGLTTQLVASTAKASNAEGRAAGLEQGREEGKS